MNSTTTHDVATADAPVADAPVAGIAPTAPIDDHLSISPSILYFGTPVALLTTENPDGTANLAPISSAWALGHTLVLGLGAEGRTVANLAERPELVVNLPPADLWAAVERLAPLTGADPVPAGKRGVYRHEPDKFAATGLHPRASEAVGPPRVDECPLQLEAVVRGITSAGPDSGFRIVECEVVRVHAAASVVVPGTQHIDPAAWNPLIYNFRHYFGLARPELGHGFRSQTP
ncbi:flavin reductase family protein [Streptomyces sp. BA2]|uniref:flavin reductase family protein n=1 Tax=Streptomyces sp. BA2 TaxID=436595 RepID=UPI00132C2EDD|nr:flavin reductase family protein [Streptomyces sp. BA2]MWA09303.1 flavin reductase family protein [Streptomyces sp. BA2]